MTSVRSATPWRKWMEVDLPLLWIAAEPLLTLFSRELKNIDAGQSWTATKERGPEDFDNQAAQPRNPHPVNPGFSPRGIPICNLHFLVGGWGSEYVSYTPLRYQKYQVSEGGTPPKQM